MLLKARDESAPANVITLRDASAPQNGPHIEITHKPRTGVTGEMTIVPWRLTDRSSMGVNVANGNLIVRSTDVRIAGTGLDFVATRTYNNRMPSAHGELQF